MKNMTGYGVFTKQNIDRGSLILEYRGQLISSKEAEIKSTKYASLNLGCFMYYFRHGDSSLCIDATLANSFGKFVNDSPDKFANCQMKKHVHARSPVLILVALQDIPKYTELRYNYGEITSKMSWRTDKTLDHLLQPQILSGDMLGDKSYQFQDSKKHRIANSNKDSEPVVRNLKPPFIKVTDNSQLYQPIYAEGVSILDCSLSWLENKREHKLKSNLKNVGSYGFCERCNTHYKDLKQHLLDDRHKKPNGEEYAGVDAAIAMGCSFSSFITSLSCKNKDPNDDIKFVTEHSKKGNTIEICDMGNEDTYYNVTLNVNDDEKAVMTKTDETLNVNDDEKAVMNRTDETLNVNDDEVAVMNRTDETLNVNDDEKAAENSRDIASISIDQGDKKYVKYKRLKRICPQCKEVKINLPLHLRLVHKWSKESSTSATSQFNLRKKYKFQAKDEIPVDINNDEKVTDNKKDEEIIKTKKCKQKDYHHKRICPIEGCFRVTKNIGEHLRSNIHRLKPGPRYQALIKQALRYDPSIIPKDVVGSPRQSLMRLQSRCNNEEEGRIDEKEHFIKNIVQVKKVIPIPKQDIPISKQIVGSESTETVSSVAFELNPVQEFNSSCSDEDYELSTEGEFDTGEELEDCSVQVERLLAQFFDYFTGPDCGRKACSIEQSVNDIKRILIASGANHHLAVIFDEDSEYLRKNYIQDHCVSRKMTPGTIKKYLNSLKDFCVFLLLKHKTLATDISKENIEQLIRNITMWRKNYRGREKLRTHQRREEDYAMLVTPEQVSSYLNSEKTVQVIKLRQRLEKYPGREITQSEYACFRDHIFFLIHFGSAHRSGVTAHMTMNEFMSRRSIGEGVTSINVWDHKTVEYYGPARLALTEEDLQWINLFVTCIRPKLSSINSDQVFLSWNGNAMTSGDVSSRLHNLWKQAGNFANKLIPKRLSANIIRKSASTLVRESSQHHQKKGIVAGSMMHSDKTADEHYFIRNQENAALGGSKIVKENFFNNSLPCTPKKKWKSEEIQNLLENFDGGESLGEIISKSRELKVEASPKQIYNKLKSLERYGSPPRRCLQQTMAKLSGRAVWSDEDLRILRTAGKSLIDGSSLTISRVQTVLEDSGLLEKFSMAQIRTRVNYEKSNR